ncbi:hypothetical protein jhhlp_004628 [Lomentospora prolificans]|uniref:MOZ protein represents a chromatin-associated acetyltransferase n=1 Tax=Lomentospora prolificans TaxID=41688 RepID=A0A2N3NC29_9PEZI|nr:hypothetical protein jhhlp_004628 [Lomentospora prolificans]
MPTGRLTSLYPRIARVLRQAEPLARPRPVVAPRTAVRRHTSNIRRHGKAVQFHSAKGGEGTQAKEHPGEPATEQEAPAQEPDDSPDASPSPPTPEETKRSEEEVQEAKSEAKKSGPMETVLYMNGPPGSIAAVKTHPPMPFSHFFDSYAMVNRLVEAGYERSQAITMMKAVRGLLRDKMAAAQEDLVSKSDVDNSDEQETYLFKAACSELSTEVKNNRRAADEVMREQRMRLQHEVDVIWQTLNHELLTLKDTVRGLFDDRKMAVREEQKANAGSIQKINYKISTLLSSDTKSDIEGLRWVLIRRSALGIAFMAVVSLATLRYAAYVKQQRKEEVERQKREEEERKKMFAGAGEVRGPVTDPDEILATA